MTEMRKLRLVLGLTLALMALGLVASGVALFVALDRGDDATGRAYQAQERAEEAEKGLGSARTLIDSLLRHARSSDEAVQALQTQVSALASPTATTPVAGTPGPRPSSTPESGPVPVPIPTVDPEPVPDLPALPGEDSCTQAIREYLTGGGSLDAVLAECRQSIVRKVSKTDDVHGKSRGHGKGRKA